ncbi:TetR/AcrR family transcriptional regulator [Halocalculus aciditolerans]|uniref:HTH tetR-type domain-containing protein n=1 Tax=Halocalculus aciditolerans TaxID=1383812 RepID=A0A830FHQ6_9EURY|nr:TetR/AcrR family transcriptional regulator [Halocalculus aciditolerans]GGL56414.1 hypothetical protein GCM10009039_13150 [Halocalculus aciditolerans]
MDDDAGEPADTREALMRATFRALCEHGYADLSIQRIADEFEKSKSLIYYHYDDKDALLLDFLDYMHERFTTGMSEMERASPDEQLLGFYDTVSPEELDAEQSGFLVALFELRTKAPHDDAYRQSFTDMDELMKEHLARYLESGIEAGVFRDVDVDETAELLLSAFTGVMVERATTDMDDRVGVHREAFEAYVDDLRVDD